MDQPITERYAILVVDDDPLINRLLARVLGGWGHEVVCATDSAEALERFAAGRFDAVLADQNLADDLGLELLDRFEAMREDRPAPALIVMSGELGSWPRPHVTKPFDFEALRSLLHAQVQLARSSDQQ